MTVMKAGRALLIVLAFAGGVWLVTRGFASVTTILNQARKIAAVMSLIESAYVEAPDLDRLTEGAVEGMLKRLDPHSVYIPAQEQKELAERDIGEFQGIGISFVIRNELITVVAPVVGSPSDRLGIRAGDRVVEIDGVSAYGISEDEVFKKLRGPKGTTVNLKVLREGLGEPLDFTVVRDDIPLRSVWTSFMLDDLTGYLLLNQFTATTSQELGAALNELERRGMKRLIFDLRNNQGGRLNEAVATADLFIPGGYVMVSRKGREHRDDSTYHSTDADDRPLWDLIVLINGGSASASEIVAAAVQDLDRGLVVGQRSFGKGLVQNSYPLKDGSVIRLSTAHWYAPSGRLVQIPYDKGRGEYYAVRYRNQGLEAPLEQNRIPYQTLGGRTVYATSGVTPDSTVEETRVTAATAQLISSQMIFSFAASLAREHGLQKGGGFERFRRDFLVTDAELERLILTAKEKGHDYPREALAKDADYIKALLKAELAQLVWNSRDAYYIVMMDRDPVVAAARGLFPTAQMVAARWRRG